MYKTVNPDGSVSFSDKETKESQQIEIRKPITYPALPYRKLTPPAKKTNTGLPYRVTVISPANDATVVGQQDVTIQVAISPTPPAKSHYRFRYVLMDKTVETRARTVTFKNVYRGTHRIEVVMLNADGKPISEPAHSVFHMKRAFK